MNIKLKFDSPFIVGGIKRVSNYIESLDYIPGNVVRAAFAKKILMNCPYHKPDEVVEIDGISRKNWVYFRDKPLCGECQFKGLCQKFSEIKFSYFYPEGITIIPMSTMRCKMHPEHGFVDILTEKPVCTKCPGKNGRVESVTGYMKDGSDYSVTKTFSTKTSIDKYTETAKDGLLYSTLAVTATDGQDNIFEGVISGVTEEDLKSIDILRIGKYISTGFGKCNIILEETGSRNTEGIEEKLELFSKAYKEFHEIEDVYNYFGIKFVSDAKLDFKLNGEHTYMTTDEYKDIWLQSLNLEKGIKIEKVLAEVFNFRGYDMSKVEEDKRETPIHMVEKGSVIVFRTMKNLNEIFDDFSNLDGFGNDTLNGFGQFEFYFGRC